MEWTAHAFGDFLDAMPDAAVLIEGEKRIVFGNSKAAELFGVPRAELDDLPLASALKGRDPIATADGAPPSQPASSRRAGTESWTLRRADGRLVPVEVSRSDVILDGRPRSLAVVRDVSDRKRAEDELRKSEQRLAQAVRVSEIGIFDHDHSSDTHYWTPRQYAMYGWPPDEPVRVPTFLARLHADDREAIGVAIRSAHDPKGDGSFDVEHRIIRADGEIRWVSTRSLTFFAGDGESRHAIRTVGASLDFTDRKHAEEALARFRHSIDQAPDAIFWLERDGSLTYVNEEACRSLGYSRDELMELRLWDIDLSSRQDDWTERWEQFERAKEGKHERHESVHRRKDGTVFPVEVVGQHISLRGRPLHVAYARDISARRQAEEGRERMAAILDATPDLVAIADPQGQILYLNRSARAFFGVERIEDVRARRVPQGHGALASKLVLEVAIPTAMRDGMWRGETSVVDARGHEIPTSQVILAHRDAQGRVAFLSSIARDLTKEKDLEAQFLQAQKMEAIGRLAGGVAHDFNNLLSVMLGSATLAARALPPNHPSLADIEEVMRAGERAAELTRGMLAFSRKQVLRPQVVDVNAILSGLTPMMRRLIGEHIELRASLTPDVGRIKADPSHLEQVILNLVVNARDAMGKGGILTLRTREAVLDEAYARSHMEILPGRYVVIGVSDDGIGMDAATKARIFEPFFTTKGPGQGTGLGLSMAFGIVKQSGGEIIVHTEPGRGTTLELYFPRTNEAPHVEIPSLLPPPIPATHGRLVLLVEDEMQLRRLVGTVLRRAGYEVLVAPGPAEALELARHDTRPIDLLLTDVVMPHMNGKDLADRLSAERPGTRVLFTSGYTENSIAYDGVLREGLHFLPKPFTPELLLTTVHRVLESTAAWPASGEANAPGRRLEPTP
jgi:two-component system cell cycle sensor histidine kinase/response regulator CckA